MELLRERQKFWPEGILGRYLKVSRDSTRVNLVGIGHTENSSPGYIGY